LDGFGQNRLEFFWTVWSKPSRKNRLKLISYGFFAFLDGFKPSRI
jgi:hypothetical protein